MATLEEAERIVKEVTGYYGYLDHDMMDDIGRFNSDYRRRIDENWLKMENAASHSIKVLARNIYGSGARFVFELLQNAEDNSFRKADGKNDPPFISFQIHPKHIVVECNEDGFTSLDLKAICSVGESTKTAKHGYVGAKGIGFKSVFIAASRVHIQSGNFSFEFRHNRNDPGLGMVRPIWVRPTETFPSPLTRTTLYLHDQGDEDEIEHLKTVIAMQFDDLQETCLLFLRKLSKISVAFYDEEGNLQRSKQFTKKKVDDYRVSLETTVVSGDESATTSQMYHITKQLATGLAQSESRDAATTTEEARKSLTSAEVVLAFPLQSNYQPQISTRRQELFAFLPLRTSDYKFHIQSDFDTNANRQDIVNTARRNLNIRDWIAKTFLQAILEFSQHPVLCYNWPLFLPSQDSGHDSFWSGLDAKILSLVQNNPILRSRNRSDLRLIREVVVASNGMKHDGGKVLLDDPVNDPFISAKYPYKVTGHLKPYGLRVASTSLKSFDSCDGNFILAPYNEDESTWTEPDNCVWGGPSDLDSVYSLKSAYKRRGLSDEDISNIENLFLGTLGIRNISAQGIVSELECRWGTCGDKEDDGQILSLYTYLHEQITVTPGVRAAFEQSPLIFLRQQSGPDWYKTSDCLWSSTAPIRGKVTLDETYEDLKALFVGKLGVKSLTMQMVYDELRQSPESSIEDIKVALFSFNDFLQSEDGNWDPEPIKTAKIFPVVYPDGTTVLRSMGVEFAIADRDNLRSKFSDKIALLDFDLGDIHRLKPLFSWLKIQERYLSKCVVETTAISGDSRVPISLQKRDLGLKAYQICRVAATFRSPRFQHDETHLYDQLRAMKVLEVEGISSVLKLSQNGVRYEARLSTASEHIDEPAGNLTIYVPRDRRAQEVCFGSVLPRKFAAWLMRNPHTNIDGNVEVDIINALTSIFASDRAVLDEILDDQGMIQLQFEDPDEDLNEEEIGGEQVEDNHASDSTPEPGYEVSDPVLTPTHSSVNDTSILPSAMRDFEIEDGALETEGEIVETQSSTSHQVRRGDGSTSRPLLHHSPEGRPFSPEQLSNHRPVPSYPASQATEYQRYRTILERVIAAARFANFPSGGAFDLNELRGALPDSGEPNSYLSYDGLDVLSRFQSTSQQERDKKIGAAGELYVFELLSKLELPGWGRGNWQSTIRTYANIHPEYADLSHWPNRETADLVYSDTQGDLTRILVDAEILSGDWSARLPKYYIEVKTTTGPCGTPFYMSGNQYRLMERIHHSSDFAEVYIIFRVYFLLDREQINYCVYPDPKRLQDDEKLIFTGTTWSVSPGLQV
ncbi:hypothetical protein NW769_002629 [Fusarium oxysporum]|nr:hypothetical protein NW769_002629 [Fusarium oxysporum]